MPKIAILSVDIDVNKGLTPTERKHDYIGPQAPSEIISISVTFEHCTYVAVVAPFFPNTEDAYSEF